MISRLLPTPSSYKMKVDRLRIKSLFNVVLPIVFGNDVTAAAATASSAVVTTDDIIAYNNVT